MQETNPARTTVPDPEAARRLARALLDIEAVILSPAAPFTWASGLRAPIYCDNRITLAYPAIRQRITEGFVAAIAALDRHPDVIVGTATAGIPHAAWVADRLQLPLAYVRAKPKAHGRGNQIEGRIREGQRAVVIEDLISTGGSAIQAADALTEAGLTVSQVLAIFTYGLPLAAVRFAEAEYPYQALTTFDTLLEVAQETGALAAKARTQLQHWQADPSGWSDRQPEGPPA